MNLKRHLKETKHHSSLIKFAAEEPVEVTMVSQATNLHKCQFYDEEFKTKNQPMGHRKDQHPTFKPCKYINTDKGYPWDKNCFYNHKTIKPGNVVCFECGEKFSAQIDLMKHRKSNHRSFQLYNGFFKVNVVSLNKIVGSPIDQDLHNPPNPISLNQD